MRRRVALAVRILAGLVLAGVGSRTDSAAVLGRRCQTVAGRAVAAEGR